MTEVFRFGNRKRGKPSKPYLTIFQPTLLRLMLSKTRQIGTRVRNISLDPTEPHVAACIRLLVQHHSNADGMFKRMMSKLRTYPPTICLFDYKRKNTSSVAALDRRRAPAKIFVDLRLAKALEAAQGEHELRLQFILFTALSHELAHNLVSVLFKHRLSDENLRFKDWHGENLDEKDGIGESGYVLEGHLFGGILDWGRRPRETQDRTRPIRSMIIHTSLQGDWSESNIQELFLRRNSIKDDVIFVIASLDSLSDRVNRVGSLSPLRDAEIRKALLA